MVERLPEIEEKSRNFARENYIRTEIPRKIFRNNAKIHYQLVHNHLEPDSAYVDIFDRYQLYALVRHIQLLRRKSNGKLSKAS